MSCLEKVYPEVFVVRELDTIENNKLRKAEAEKQTLH